MKETCCCALVGVRTDDYNPWLLIPLQTVQLTWHTTSCLLISHSYANVHGAPPYKMLTQTILLFKGMMHDLKPHKTYTEVYSTNRYLFPITLIESYSVISKNLYLLKKSFLILVSDFVTDQDSSTHWLHTIWRRELQTNPF